MNPLQPHLARLKGSPGGTHPATNPPKAALGNSTLSNESPPPASWPHHSGGKCQSPPPPPTLVKRCCRHPEPISTRCQAPQMLVSWPPASGLILSSCIAAAGSVPKTLHGKMGWGCRFRHQEPQASSSAIFQPLKSMPSQDHSSSIHSAKL